MRKGTSFVWMSILLFCLSGCTPNLIVKKLEVNWDQTNKSAQVEIANIGIGNAGNFLVYFNADENPVSPNRRPQISYSILSLARGHSLILQADFAPLAHPENNNLANVYKITVIADPKHMVKESNENDNISVSSVVTDSDVTTGTTGTYNPPSISIVDIVKSLPENATMDQLLPRLDELIGATMSITRRDMPLMREAIMNLRGQPLIVGALYQKYQSLPREVFGRGRQIVAITGELQLDNSLELLSRIVWTPLPDVPSVPEGLSARNYEEIIQMKAVEGIAFHRGADGARTSYAIENLENIMLSHPSKSVRTTAIDAYMWNDGDSADSASRLYQILPADLHPYVEMPRFSSGTNRETFERRLNDWRDRWVK